MKWKKRKRESRLWRASIGMFGFQGISECTHKAPRRLQVNLIWPSVNFWKPVPNCSAGFSWNNVFSRKTPKISGRLYLYRPPHDAFWNHLTKTKKLHQVKPQVGWGWTSAVRSCLIFFPFQIMRDNSYFHDLKTLWHEFCKFSTNLPWHLLWVVYLCNIHSWWAAVVFHQWWHFILWLLSIKIHGFLS